MASRSPGTAKASFMQKDAKLKRRRPRVCAAPTAPTGANQFSNEGQAKSHCAGGDIVVWANLNSKIYHFGGHKDCGHTKEGAYMCEKDALGQGIRAAKNEKHP